jgi:hypothetical protein
VDGNALKVGRRSRTRSDRSVGGEAEALVLAQLTEDVVGFPYSLVLDLEVETMQVLPRI